MPKVLSTRQRWAQTPARCSSSAEMPLLRGCQGPDQLQGASASHLSQACPPGGRSPLHGQELAFSKVTSLPNCELLELPTNGLLLQGLGTHQEKVRLQNPLDRYSAPPDTTWQAEHISLRLSPQPGVLAQGTACTTALGSPEREVREGGRDGWTSLTAPRHQHGVLTKLALSAVIHPHPLSWCARQCVSEALSGIQNDPAPLPRWEHRRCLQPTHQVHDCNSICWLPGASPGDRVAPQGQGTAGKASGTTLWGHTGVSLNPSSATY